MTSSAYRTLPDPEEPRVCSRDEGFDPGQGDATLLATTTAFTPSLIHARITDHS